MAKIFRDFDWLIFLPIIILAGFSLSLLATPPEGFFNSQLIFFIIGVGLFFVVSQIDWQIYKSLAIILYFIALILLIITFFGPQVRGATRWIEIFGVRWQPSELVKPLIIISLASFFSNRSPKELKNLFLGLLLVLPMGLLTFRQPDLGNTVIIIGIWLGVVYGAGLPFFYGLAIMLTFILILPLGWFFLKNYQKLRLVTFLNPFFDPAGAGYNSIQSMIAVGSGQLFGRGLGQGSQSHLLFLPEYHTDFIFASLIEELGFIGGIIVIAAYAVLLYRILQITRETKDLFAVFLLLGIFSQLLLHIFVNIGMNLGFLPITGITLPLLSYGGSSILSTMILLGIVSNISKSRTMHRAIDILPPANV